MTAPSAIPPRGRELELAEREALLADLEDIVRSSHLFKSLDEAGRTRLMESGYVMQFEPGDRLMVEGAPGEVMFLIMSGLVFIETTGAKGAVPLAELSRGACLGEVSVLTGSLRTASVSAKTHTSVVAFAKHRIERIMNDYPKVRSLLEAMVEGRARDTVEKIISS